MRRSVRKGGRYCFSTRGLKGALPMLARVHAGGVCPGIDRMDRGSTAAWCACSHCPFQLRPQQLAVSSGAYFAQHRSVDATECAMSCTRAIVAIQAGLMSLVAPGVGHSGSRPSHWICSCSLTDLGLLVNDLVRHQYPQWCNGI